MKIERLMGIVSVLTQKDSVTATELAERFEVSVRTIHRDIDQLCRAGIPVVTRQGTGGGISIMENYKLGPTALTRDEMRDVLAGLRSLDSVTGSRRYGRLMEKLSAGSPDLLSGEASVLIDLSSWYGDILKPRIDAVRRAIDGQERLRFRYYAPKGDSLREVEPYYLIFRWSSWYLWGWCLDRRDFRMFKLNRMDGIEPTGTRFEKRQVPMPDLRTEKIFPGGIRVKALFTPDCKWRLIEEFGSKSITVRPDGKLLFQADYTDRESLFTWLLTFQDKVELLEPADMRREILALAERLKGLYAKEDLTDELS